MKSSNDNKAGVGNSENALQKSIQKATKVLDLSSADNTERSSLSGDLSLANCDSTRKYGYPTLHFANGTSDTVKRNMNLSMEICANPPVDHIIWQLPNDGQLLKPGQQSIDKGLVLQSVQANATCFHVSLVAQTAILPNGNHLILFMNRLGYQQRRIQVQVLQQQQMGAAAPISQCDSVRPRIELLMLLTSCQIIYHTFR